MFKTKEDPNMNSRVFLYLKDTKEKVKIQGAFSQALIRVCFGWPSSGGSIISIDTSFCIFHTKPFGYYSNQP
jgi:hypothetical protein